MKAPLISIGKTVAVSAFLLSQACLANNLSITDVSLTNPSGGQADIQFTMSWDNSWYESWTETGGTINLTNWDAIWVFAKYRQNGGLWKHVRLTAAGHAPTGGTAIDVPDDSGGLRLGAFVRRTAAGTGTVTCTNMRLHWDLAAAGLASPNDIDITVMGVEMVYIPEGPFFLGSGGDEAAHFYAAPDTSAPFLVTGEAEVPVGDDPGNLNATGALNGGPIPPAYPKGFRAFYCMKYELTEGQYVDFLNLLDPAAAGPFFPDAAGSQRHAIAAAAGGGFESLAPDRACNYMSAARLLGYLDWCGLRPMTEFEFEKSCRGPKQPWIHEYAWGNATRIDLTGFQGTDGSGTETALPANANCHFGAPFDGPVRAGIFATGSTTREQAGSGYYGVMELTASMGDLAVGANRVDGRVFDGSHGDGNEFNGTSQWPSPGSYAFSMRGGSTATSSLQGRVSDRGRAESRDYSSASHHAGGRGVRTAP